MERRAVTAAAPITKGLPLELERVTGMTEK